MFLKSKLIKHNRMMDVCVEVVSVIETNNHFKFKIRWINLGYVESYYIFSTTDWIKIHKDAIKNWDWGYITDDKCYRNINWRPMPTLEL